MPGVSFSGCIVTLEYILAQRESYTSRVARQAIQDAVNMCRKANKPSDPEHLGQMTRDIFERVNIAAYEYDSRAPELSVLLRRITPERICGDPTLLLN